MSQHGNKSLDGVFTALSDPTRRAIIARLSEGPASVKVLAEPHKMALSSFLKHIAVLERSDLVVSTKKGRVRTCTLNANAFRPAQSWMMARQVKRRSRLDDLSSMLAGMRAENAPEK